MNILPVAAFRRSLARIAASCFYVVNFKDDHRVYLRCSSSFANARIAFHGEF